MLSIGLSVTIMILGYFFVISACFCWGLIFVVPKFLPTYSPIEIALGRFFFFGLISLFFLLLNKRYLLQKKYKILWIKSIGYGLVSTIICYTCLIICMRYTSSAMGALIYGISPISIAIFGNWHNKEFSYKKLVIPLLLIAIGIMFVNFNAFHFAHVNTELYWLGLLVGISGLASWTWYTVANFNFIKKTTSITTTDWIIMMGVTILISITFISSFLIALDTHLINTISFDLEFRNFILGSLVLGAISSWAAFFFWNQGNLRLPISLAGQLTIFEMIFGLILIYFVDSRLPAPLELIGISLMIGGVLIACNTLNSNLLSSPIKSESNQ